MPAAGHTGIGTGGLPPTPLLPLPRLRGRAGWGYCRLEAGAPGHRPQQSPSLPPQALRHSAVLADDAAVVEVELPVAAAGELGVVGDQQQCRAEPGVLLEQAIDDDAA